MLPDDWRDGLTATIGLIALISVGIFLKFGAVNIFAADASSGDDIELALLNVLRAETTKGDVADLIALNENDRNYLTMVDSAVIQNLNFAFGDAEYFLKITYPNGDELFFSPFIDLGVTAEESFEKGKIESIDVEIPSLNNGIIKIELGVRNE